MWNREGIKKDAKEFLRYNYWKAFKVCLIVFIISGSINFFAPSVEYNEYNENGIFRENDGTAPFEVSNLILRTVLKKVGINPIVRLPLSKIQLVGFLLLILYMTLNFPLEVGKSRFFLRGLDGDLGTKYLFSTFKGNEFFNIFKTQFLRSLYILLWSLLLIIPGIIKSYEYRMVPYILANNPNMPTNEVIRMSRNITNGHKMDIFVLELSFIGWYLLGALLIGLGGVFVDPYRDASLARLYNILSGNDVKDEKILVNDMY